MPPMESRAIEGEIDRIRSLGLEELRREWRRLNHAEPPRISRDLFVLALGYRLQEIAHGGLGKATRRKLQTLAKALQTTGRVGPTPSLSLKPGVTAGGGGSRSVQSVRPCVKEEIRQQKGAIDLWKIPQRTITAKEIGLPTHPSSLTSLPTYPVRHAPQEIQRGKSDIVPET
jgi:hypothetical protein